MSRLTNKQTYNTPLYTRWASSYLNGFHKPTTKKSLRTTKKIFLKHISYNYQLCILPHWFAQLSIENTLRTKNSLKISPIFKCNQKNLQTYANTYGATVTTKPLKQFDIAWILLNAHKDYPQTGSHAFRLMDLPKECMLEDFGLRIITTWKYWRWELYTKWEQRQSVKNKQGQRMVAQKQHHWCYFFLHWWH